MKLAEAASLICVLTSLSKQKLGEASAPPVRPIALGSGDKAVKTGEETVLFRHDKRFVNPCVFALEIKDSLPDADIRSRVEGVLNSEIDRVGQKLKIDAIALINDSNDAGRFESAAKTVAATAPGVPVIICTADPQATEAAVKPFADKKPVLYGTNSVNTEAMVNIAKTYKATLGVTANGLDELVILTEKVKSLGIEDMVIDSGRGRRRIYWANTLIRAAVKRTLNLLAICVFAVGNKLVEALIAAVRVAKYLP
jgi:acetyl-CoA decarbonylase/synthase complex subunit gamma